MQTVSNFHLTHNLSSNDFIFVGIGAAHLYCIATDEALPHLPSNCEVVYKRNQYDKYDTHGVRVNLRNRREIVQTLLSFSPCITTADVRRALELAAAP